MLRRRIPRMPTIDAHNPTNAKQRILVRSIFTPIARPASGLSPATRTCKPNLCRWKIIPNTKAIKTIQNICAGIGPKDPTKIDLILVSFNSSKVLTAPLFKTLHKPIKAKFIPKVVIKEERPSFVTRKPFNKPQDIPTTTEKIVARRKFKLVCCKVQAKANPDNGMIDGKARSISPAAVTKTRLNPIIAKSGRDKKTAE